MFFRAKISLSWTSVKTAKTASAELNPSNIEQGSQQLDGTQHAIPTLLVAQRHNLALAFADI